MLTEKKLAELIASICLEEKAYDVVVLDVGDLTIVADYFVVATGRSQVQIRSIIEAVEEKLKEYGVEPSRKEGNQQGGWVVLDYNSTILHVFREEEREYYNLENLWGDAPRVNLGVRLSD